MTKQEVHPPSPLLPPGSASDSKKATHTSTLYFYQSRGTAINDTANLITKEPLCIHTHIQKITTYSLTNMPIFIFPFKLRHQNSHLKKLAFQKLVQITCILISLKRCHLFCLVLFWTVLIIQKLEVVLLRKV